MTNARKGALILASSLVLAIVSEVRAHGEPVIVVEPAVVAAGGEVTVTGSEMEPGETFTIVLDGTAASVSLGEATAAGEGQEAGFVVEYAIPADLPPGSYILRATTEEGETAAADLTITAPTEAAADEPVTVQEPSGELHVLDRGKSLPEVAGASIVALIAAVLGFRLILARE
ncbi:MAG: hypothetical protein A2Z66_09875 [Chloroflexi bacterium RBG_13_66_10]|nr:MAG: hypothetical protein A2Z66_09875 [Chloroflexi bacterium RBG_13_66_10]